MRWNWGFRDAVLSLSVDEAFLLLYGQVLGL